REEQRGRGRRRAVAGQEHEGDVRQRLPREALGVQPRLQAEGAVDPGAVAVGERGEVVGLAPDQQAAGGLLQAVAGGRVVVLVGAAVADDVGDQVVQRAEAELERAAGGRGARRPTHQRERQDDPGDRAEGGPHRAEGYTASRAGTPLAGAGSATTGSRMTATVSSSAATRQRRSRPQPRQRCSTACSPLGRTTTPTGRIRLPQSLARSPGTRRSTWRDQRQYGQWLRWWPPLGTGKTISLQRRQRNSSAWSMNERRRRSAPR